MADDPLIGARVGNYQIVSLLGEGGMARVYRASHPEIGREVAVKVLAPHVAAMPDVLRRFRVEAQAVNKIDHPNIIHIFDFGTLPDGRQFYLMELLHGESLADHIRRVGAMPLDETLAITDTVLDALDAVHRAGIVHRDLKPDNVFLAQSGGRRIVKLLDFGIVKLLGDGPLNKTQTGSLLGTPSYMAPEQCEGKVQDIGPRTDLYAVGCMMYEMLAGVLPFDADSLGGLLLQHLTQTPRPLIERIAGLPLPLSHLVARCLAKDPGQRPETADWLRQQLRPFLAGGAALTAPTLGVTPSEAKVLLPSVHPSAPAVSISATPEPTGSDRASPPASPPATVDDPPRGRSRMPVVAAGAGLAVLAAIAIVLAISHQRAAAAPSDAGLHATSASAPHPDAAPDAPSDGPTDAVIDAPVLDAAAHPPTLKERLEGLKRMCDDHLFTPSECKDRREAIKREWDR